MQTAAFAAPLNHPSYSGHFPGHPIVAGVLLLELIVEALDRGSPRGFGSVKFSRAVLPGDSLTLRYSVAGNRVTFRCERAAGELVADGSVEYP